MSVTDDIQPALAELLLALQRFASAQRTQFGLSMNEEAVLECLARGITAPSEVSRTIGMTTAGMTNLLDRLQTGGFVLREPHAADKRRILLTLTKRGYRTQLELDDLLATLGESTMQGADPAELDAIVRFLRASADLIEARRRELAAQTARQAVKDPKLCKTD